VTDQRLSAAQERRADFSIDFKLLLGLVYCQRSRLSLTGQMAWFLSAFVVDIFVNYADSPLIFRNLELVTPEKLDCVKYTRNW